MGTKARLEPSLANSSAISFFSSQDMQVLKTIEIVL
jgi:hypothetical protein